MTTLLLIAITCPLCLLLGVFVGAWMAHRLERRLSPVPDVAAAVKSVIGVCFPKKKPQPTGVYKPKMRA